MKASRLAHLCSAAARHSLVGAFVLVSLLSASQPVEAHGDVKGDAAMPVTSGATGPQMTVYRSASCGCCTSWGSHIASAGYRIEDHVTENMDAVKKARGVSPQQASCHTAVVEGYVIEGHVPASAIQRLLTERPNIRGLAVPGMPMGSPGMEVAFLVLKIFTKASDCLTDRFFSIILFATNKAFSKPTKILACPGDNFLFSIKFKTSRGKVNNLKLFVI